MVRQRGAWAAAALMLLLLGLWATHRYFLSPAAVARGTVIDTVEGDAIVKRNGTTLRLRGDSGIYTGDIIVCRDHATELSLHGGTTIRMGPLTELLVGDQPGFRLLRGAIRLETTAQSTALTVGAPYAVARTTPFGVSVMDVSMDSGMFVRVGEVAVQSESKQVVVQAGQHLNVDGLVFRSEAQDPVSLEDFVFHTRQKKAPPAPTETRLPVVLLSAPGSKVAHQRVTADYTDTQKTRLQPGDTVITGKAGGRLLVDTWGELMLDGNTRISLVQATAEANHAEAALRIEQGGLQFHVVGDPNQQRRIDLQVGAQQAAITPAYRQAWGRFDSYKQKPHFTLHQGRINIGSKEAEAGSIVQLDGFGQGADAQVLPLAPETVDVAGTGTTIVHHAGNIPAVKFHWGRKAGQAQQVLELARDDTFHDVRWTEALQHGAVIVDVLKSGRKYYWRLDKGPAATLRIVPQLPFGCATCSGPNAVTDQVARTMIQFEESMPSLDFAWKPIEGTATYLFRLYRDNRFDTPAFVTHADNPNFTVPADKLLPGAYIWRVAGYDGEGRLVRTSQSYELDVQDLDSHLLSIVVPQPGSEVAGNSVLARGVVQGGSGLTCNGQLVQVGDDGVFSHEVPLHPGENLLAFDLRDSQGVRHVFTRVVHADFNAGKVAPEARSKVSEQVSQD